MTHRRRHKYPTLPCLASPHAMIGQAKHERKLKGGGGGGGGRVCEPFAIDTKSRKQTPWYLLYLS